MSAISGDGDINMNLVNDLTCRKSPCSSVVETVPSHYLPCSLYRNELFVSKKENVYRKPVEVHVQGGRHKILKVLSSNLIDPVFPRVLFPCSGSKLHSKCS